MLFITDIFIHCFSGFPVATSQVRLAEIKAVLVKTEEEEGEEEEVKHNQQQAEHPKQQQRQQQQQQRQQVQSNENIQNTPASPNFHDENREDEFLVRHSNVLAARQAAPFSTPLTTMPSSPVSSPIRLSFAAPGTSVNTRPGVAVTALSSQRFYPPTTFSSFQQNGYQSPPRSVMKVPSRDPAINGHRMTSTAIVSHRNIPRHLQPTQMNISELHQAVEPLSFHTSEPLHDAASRLLSVSLRFGRRLPCFRRLPFRDQVILLEEGWKEMLLLDSVFWMFPLTPGGPPGAENDQRRDQEVKTVQEALRPLKTLKLDNSEYACLKTIILFRTSKLIFRFFLTVKECYEMNKIETVVYPFLNSLQS